MSLILVYDTETTGIPDWKVPSDSPHQPHIVQLAAALVDMRDRSTRASINLIVRPDGWDIPAEVSEIHGFTNETATLYGVTEKTAVRALLELWGMQRDTGTAPVTRVAFNETFDARIIRIALKRYFGEDTAASWKEGPAECAMRMAKSVMEVGQYPKLSEAYQSLTGIGLDDAHDAMIDVQACLSVYLICKDKVN